jgi:hypothetical protein
LFTAILVISPVNVRTASGRAIKNQQIWLLVKLHEHQVMVIYYLQFFQYVIHGLNRCYIHVCVDISLFLSYHVGGTASLLMGNGSI